MEKRTILAVVLSIAVFYIFSYFTPQPPPHKPSAVQKGMSTAAPSVATAANPAATGMAGVSQAPAAANASVKYITLDTELYTAVFSTQGARLKSLVLKKYTETAGPGAKSVTLFSADKPEFSTLGTVGSGIDISPDAVYSVNVSSDIKAGKGEKGSIEFTWTSPRGTVVHKIYSYSGDEYAIGLDARIANRGAEPLAGSLNLLLTYKLDAVSGSSRFETKGPVTLSEGKLVSETVKDANLKDASIDKDVSWTGYADKYFLDAVIAKSGSIAGVKIHKIEPLHAETVISSPRLTIAPGQEANVAYQLYFGPKDLNILKAQGSNLEKAIDFGWFAVIAKPLLGVLKVFYRYTHNYGIAIIIITVIIKLLFFPLTYKSYKSMKDMQKLQPMMNKLKEKYKSDREALNREMMKLYQEHKVNPLGGCLPMLIQIPVFFGLYRALMYSIELRHSPFIFWIQDLSAKDPYYITPVIMGITMFIQQKMTPSQMDPMQQKMMLMLPVVFTFMFLNFPAGLVLYWLVNNILTIAQQAYINKKVA